MGVLVVTDSAASLPFESASALSITVVPMTLVLGGVVYADGELSSDELLHRIDNESVTTASPSPGDMIKRLEAELTDGGAVILTVSSRMSSTFEIAQAAARYLDPERVRVVDTGTAAGGQGLVALAAGERAAMGAGLDEVVATAEGVAARVRLVAALQTMDYLKKSGRVPGAAAWAGRFFGVQPLFEFSQGQVRPLRPAMSQQGALDRLVEACLARRSVSARLHAAVLHAQAPDTADRLLETVVASPEAEVFVAPFSSVMTAHTGPGLTGLAWWWEDSGQSAQD